ncbi:MAG: hypothetical protein ACOYL6_07955 [Bacteriovoracaceae bacterium]|jgi:hypothetical protein
MEWLPDVCSQLHGEMVTIYWMMILPMIVLLIVLEMFKTQDKTPDAGKILVRALASILMLISFKETINLIAFMGDGIAERIDGLAKMPEILQVFSDNFNREAPALYKVRELFIFLLNFLSYFLAYFGIFVTDALIHFCWSILYVCAPLMILCYIPENTANICKNLYKGLFTVISWKIMWSILGVMLLKLAVQPTTENSENIITTSIINLCIALSILLVPLFTKSLIGDGISSFASGIATIPGMAAMGVGKTVLSMPIKKGAEWSGAKMRNGWNNIKGKEEDGPSVKPSISTQNDSKKNSNFMKK